MEETFWYFPSPYKGNFVYLHPYFRQQMNINF